MKDLLIPTYYTKESRGLHVDHIGRDNYALPWCHELSLPVGLRREHTLIKIEYLRFGQQVHAQLLPSDGCLSSNTELSGSIRKLL